MLPGIVLGRTPVLGTYLGRLMQAVGFTAQRGRSGRRATQLAGCASPE